jgi:hypothetical protein
VRCWRVFSRTLCPILNSRVWRDPAGLYRAAYTTTSVWGLKLLVHRTTALSSLITSWWDVGEMLVSVQNGWLRCLYLHFVPDLMIQVLDLDNRRSLKCGLRCGASSSLRCNLHRFTDVYWRMLSHAGLRSGDWEVIDDNTVVIRRTVPCVLDAWGLWAGQFQCLRSAYVCIRRYTSACVRIRQHTF